MVGEMVGEKTKTKNPTTMCTFVVRYRMSQQGAQMKYFA